MTSSSLLKHWPLALAFAILKCVGLVALAVPAFADDKADQAFQRVVDTGVIRCGYYVFPPITSRDPNTGELTGFAVDYMNKIAEKAALKVEWTSEVTWANWVPELQAGRFDVACTPMWPELSMLKAVSFTDPLFFAGLYPLVRKDDARFAKVDLARLNQPDVIVLGQESNSSEAVAKAVFPNAKRYILPATAGGGEFFQTLLSKKVDVVMTDRNGFFMYEKDNGKNFKFATTEPLKLQSFPLAVARGENELRDFLNQSIHELEYSGDTERILRKWEPEPGKTYLRVANPAVVAKDK
jgi:ABC-type amino acid transport substrate-binding protein